MADSLADAKADLVNNLLGAATLAPVTKLYDFEPKPGDQIRGCVATVSTVVSPAVTPDFFRLALRIYQSPEVDAKTAQDNLDAAIIALDHAVSSAYGPSEWTVEFRDDFGQFVGENILEVGREDNQ